MIGLAVHVVPNQPLAILYAFMITQAIAWTALGLAPFVKQFLPGVAITLFVLLSIPSSGGAIRYQLVPGFFRTLHPVMPLGNLIDALRGVFYFDNQGLLRPTLVLAAWMLVGAALLGVDAFRQRRREQQVAGTATPEKVVVDPSIEAPTPRAVPPGATGNFGQRTPTVGGVVREADGTPVADAFVTMLAPGGRQLVCTHTDSDGRYAASGLPENFVAIVLLARGYTPAAP